MRNLLRCRRGTVAFATVIALVPLIGVVALGGEAGSWYVTKQHAQNAADAAAYSGALLLACTLAAPCNDTKSVDYRGREFAAQNAFCSAGDTTAYPGRRCATSLPTGTSRTVQINQLTSWNGVSGNFVRATVSQQQPAYLAAVLGLSTVNIGAQAIAQVNSLPTPPCVLALTGSIGFQGSPNINAPNCGMASNDPAKDALNFTGGGMSINLGTLSAAGGCTGAASFCNSALTYRPPVTNPFSVLDTVNLPTMTPCPFDKKNPTLTPWSATNPCANNPFKLAGNSGSSITLNGGVYFISSGTLDLSGGVSISGTALFILLPGASFSLSGGSSMNINGNPLVTASQLPTALQPYANLFANMAIYDQSNSPITMGGNSDPNFTGTMYLPNADVTFQGNPTLTLSPCGELIAKSVAFNGNATFNSNGCSAATKPNSQYVRLVQ
jgi:Flp pilus assembly protein TadG